MSVSTSRSNGAARPGSPTRKASRRELPSVVEADGLGTPEGGSRRRIDVPQVLVAVLIVAGCALGAVVWMSSANSREPVLALARDLERGDVLEAGDVRIVKVDADVAIASVPAGSLDNFVGAVATADLESGALISPSQFSTGELLGEGEAVVGASLADGEYPVPDLRPGDRVDAYLMPASTTGAEAVDDDAADDEPEPDGPTGDTLAVRLLATSVEVFDVAPDTNNLFVSLRVPVELAGDVAGAADLGRLRLALVPGGAPG